jgi:hypothetical protein
MDSDVAARADAVRKEFYDPLMVRMTIVRQTFENKEPVRAATDRRKALRSAAPMTGVGAVLTRERSNGGSGNRRIPTRICGCADCERPIGSLDQRILRQSGRSCACSRSFAPASGDAILQSRDFPG